MAQEEIDRAIQRSGIADSDEVCLLLEDSQLPDERTDPAILFACLVFTLTAPLYIWGIIGI